MIGGLPFIGTSLRASKQRHKSCLFRTAAQQQQHYLLSCVHTISADWTCRCIQTRQLFSGEKLYAVSKLAILSETVPALKNRKLMNDHTDQRNYRV